MRVNGNHHWRGGLNPQDPANDRIGDPRRDRRTGVGKVETKGVLPRKMLALNVEREGIGNESAQRESGDQVPDLLTCEGIDGMRVDP